MEMLIPVWKQQQMRIRNQEAEDPFSYVLWGKEGICQLQNRDLGRFAETEIYVVKEEQPAVYIQCDTGRHGEKKLPDRGRYCPGTFRN